MQIIPLNLDCSFVPVQFETSLFEEPLAALQMLRTILYLLQRGI